MLLRIIQEIAWVPAVFHYESGVKEQKERNGLKQIHTKWVMFVSPTWTSQWKQKKGGGGEFVEIPWVWIQSEPYVAPD